MRYQFEGMPLIRMNLMLWNLYIAEPLSSAEVPAQPRPQGFSLKKWVGRPTHFLREKPWGRGWFPLGIPIKIDAIHRAPPPPALSFFLPASLRHKEAPCGRKRGIAARVTYKLPRDLPSVHVRKSVKLDSFKWQIQGRGPGGPGPPLFLDQTRKYFLEDRPPPFSQGLNPALRYLTCRRLR